MISLICAILKITKQENIQAKNLAHRHREQIGGCQRQVWGNVGKRVKEVKMYKLPVIK